MKKLKMNWLIEEWNNIQVDIEKFYIYRYKDNGEIGYRIIFEKKWKRGEEKLFIDKAKIYVKSGDGGNGAVSFRREKYVPLGGPDGGDGGKGGDIVLVSDPDMTTLLDFSYKRKYKAEPERMVQNQGVMEKMQKILYKSSHGNRCKASPER